MRLTWGLIVCLTLIAIPSLVATHMVLAPSVAVANPPDPPPPPNYEDLTPVEPGTLSYPPFFNVNAPPPGVPLDEWEWFWWKEWMKDYEFYNYYDPIDNTWTYWYDPWRVFTPEDEWAWYYYSLTAGIAPGM